MNKNEIKKFFNAYVNTICLDENLEPIKIVDMDQVSDITEFLIARPDGSQETVIVSERIIPLKGRVKERDYNYIEARFHKQWKS